MYTDPDYGYLMTEFTPILDSQGNTVGMIGVDFSANDIIDQANKLLYLMIGISIAGVLLMFIFARLLIQRAVIRPLAKIVEASDALAKGDVNATVDVKSHDEVGHLANSFREMIDNIRNQATAAEKIANGDLAVDLIPHSEKDILSHSLLAVIDNLGSLVKESNALTEHAINGELDYRGNASQFRGGFQDIIQGFNATMDAVVTPLNEAFGYIEKMAAGDEFEIASNNYTGEYKALIDDLSEMKTTIYGLAAAADQVTTNVRNGQLSYRADSSLFKGTYAQMISGINATVDIFSEFMDKAMSYMEQIGQGMIPEKITEDYLGDFAKVKANINECIDGLDGLVEGRDVLARMSLNDYAATVNGTYQGIFQEMATSINQVGWRVDRTVDVFANIVTGNFEDLDGLKKLGKRCEEDRLIPTMVLTIETIKELVEETKMLSQNAVEGNLSARGNADKFQGEFAHVITGVNETLDAMIAPMQEASSVLQEVAKGNLQLKMEGDYQGDYAEIKHALNETIDNLQSYVQEIARVLEGIGAGNLDQHITAEYKGDFMEIKTSLNDIGDSLSSALFEINQAADLVASGAKQVSDASQALSQGSTEQASTLEELTASIAEIANQTKQNAVSANQASELSNDAKENGLKGNQQMQGMLSSMVEINESSANISKIIKVIDDIAFQTNILALNAAVEAARAGQHGKGFAVVAEEVRNLAARSAEAAKETTALIEGSISKVETGTKLANATADALGEIAQGIEKSATLVGNIADASNQQASGIAQINMGIEQVSMVVQNNSATAQESAATSEELAGQAELLKGLVGTFRLKNRGGQTLDTKEHKLLSGNHDSHEIPASKPEPAASPRIVLSDAEFDKY